jgi:hypothetical protein
MFIATVWIKVQLCYVQWSFVAAPDAVGTNASTVGFTDSPKLWWNHTWSHWNWGFTWFKKKTLRNRCYLEILVVDIWNMVIVFNDPKAMGNCISCRRTWALEAPDGTIFRAAKETRALLGEGPNLVSHEPKMLILSQNCHVLYHKKNEWW